MSDSKESSQDAFSDLDISKLDLDTSRPLTRSSVNNGQSLKNNAANKFMENFNPETSVRERRKLHRKLSNNTNTTTKRKNPGAFYDAYGVHMSTGMNICDCLFVECSGCFWPCPKCGSTKCGSECRVNRKYAFDQVDYEGCNVSIKFPPNTSTK